MKNEYKFIEQIITNNHGKCYLVGGYVRDLLLNINNNDYDIATNLDPTIIQKIFKKYILSDYAIKYGNIIITINNIRFEITTFRKESNAINRNCIVSFTQDIIVDSNRRDFTINAIYYDFNKFYDFHDGIKDLNNSIIKTIVDPHISFKQDPLRMVRAIRFMATYNFKLDHKTRDALVNNCYLLINLNKDTLYKELKKFIVSKYFKDIFNEFVFLFNSFYPELYTIKLDEPLEYDYKKRIIQLYDYFNLNIDSKIINDFTQIKKIIINHKKDD